MTELSPRAAKRQKWTHGFKAGKKQGTKAERTRIIKLLEEMIDNYGNFGWTVEQAAIKVAIKLIKGENK